MWRKKCAGQADGGVGGEGAGGWIHRYVAVVIKAPLCPVGLGLLGVALSLLTTRIAINLFYAWHNFIIIISFLPPLLLLVRFLLPAAVKEKGGQARRG